MLKSFLLSQRLPSGSALSTVSLPLAQGLPSGLVLSAVSLSLAQRLLSAPRACLSLPLAHGLLCGSVLESLPLALFHPPIVIQNNMERNEITGGCFDCLSLFAPHKYVGM